MSRFSLTPPRRLYTSPAVQLQRLVNQWIYWGYAIKKIRVRVSKSTDLWAHRFVGLFSPSPSFPPSFFLFLSLFLPPSFPLSPFLLLFLSSSLSPSLSPSHLLSVIPGCDSRTSQHKSCSSLIFQPHIFGQHWWPVPMLLCVYLQCD